MLPLLMNYHQSTPTAKVVHDQAKQGQPLLGQGRVVQRQSNVDPTFAAFVQRDCTFPCQCMQTSQICARHVLGLTFAKPSSCGPSSRTCTFRAGRPRSTAGRAVRLRIVSSSVGTPGKQSMWISASRLLKVKIVVPLEMCGTWTCSDNRSLVHTYRIVSYRLGSDLDFTCRTAVENAMLDSLGTLVLSDFPHSQHRQNDFQPLVKSGPLHTSPPALKQDDITYNRNRPNGSTLCKRLPSST
jgi:hypothetical protein